MTEKRERTTEARQNHSPASMVSHSHPDYAPQGTVRKGWNPGVFWVPNEIYEAGVSGYAKAVYIYLCRRSDDEGKSFPGYGTIAKEVGFSKSSIRRAVDELIAAGLLVKENRGRKESGEFYSNEYTLIHPANATPQESLKPTDGMFSESIPMSSENTPMFSESIPMSSENTPMFSESTEGKHTKEYPLRNTTKDNTHTRETKESLQTPAQNVQKPASTKRVVVSDREVSDICLYFSKTLRVQQPIGLANQIRNLAGKYGAEKVREKIDVLAAQYGKDPGRMANPIALLIRALAEDWTALQVAATEAAKDDNDSLTYDDRYEAFYELYPELRDPSLKRRA
jgi:hypothetical protein